VSSGNNCVNGSEFLNPNCKILFVVGTPVWTPYNRSPETDNMEQRKKYLASIKGKEKKVKEVLVPTPAQFDEILKTQLNEIEVNNNHELFVLVSAEWCPDCQKGECIFLFFF
jgi:thiol-disulfide isomerase/thioredoxin